MHISDIIYKGRTILLILIIVAMFSFLVATLFIILVVFLIAIL